MLEPLSSTDPAAAPATGAGTDSSRTPRLVWVLVALNAALLCAYALMFPPFKGFDEPQHVDMALHVANGEAWPWPAPGKEPLSIGIANASNPYYFGRYSHVPYTNDPLPDRGHRPSLADLQTASGVKNYPNQMVQHPPGYYLLGAAVIKAIPGNAEKIPYDRLVSLLRLMSVVLSVPLPWIVFKALRLLGQPSTAITGAALSLAVPGLTRIGSNVQNDDLLILACSLLLLVLARVTKGDLTRRTAVYAGLLTVLALLTKGFALVLPVVVFAAYLTQRRGRRLPWQPMIIALGIGGLLGGPWYLMNLIRFGTPQPGGLGKVADASFRGPPDPPGTHRPLGTYVNHLTTALNRRFWSAIGAPDIPALPVWLCWTLTGITVALVVVAFVRGRGHRGLFTVLLLPLPLLMLIVVQGSLHWYEFNGRLPGVQGRYLYPGLLGLLVVASFGLQSLLRQRQALGPLLATVAAVGLQIYALKIIFGVYWVPGDDVGAGITGLFHWSPWNPVITAIPFIAALVLALAAVAMTARGAFRKSVRAPL